MRLTDLTVHRRRDRAVTVDANAERRHTMSLEALNRPAQSRSLKAVLRSR